jgi:hypothetical protein
MLKDSIISVRLPSAVKEALQEAADDERRSLASLATIVLTDWAVAKGLLVEPKPTKKRGGR